MPDRNKVTVEHLSSFPILSLITVHSASKRSYFDDVTFGLPEILINSETLYDGRKLTMEHSETVHGGDTIYVDQF